MIPELWTGLLNLVNCNLSFNLLAGPIPRQGAFQYLGASSFWGNRDLCGSPLVSKCSSQLGLSLPRPAIIVGAGVIIAKRLKMRKRLPTVLQVYESAPSSPDGRRRVMGKLVLFSRRLEQYFEDFTTGSKLFMTNDVIIGSGSIATVFRACLQGDKLLAVRKLPTLGVSWNEAAFEREFGKLSTVRHRSLVFLHGYYTSPSMQLVLSEYMPNGTLHQHLHQCAHELPLNWPTRLNIALDTVRALAYLHDKCRPPILHLNVKSSNIFLNSSFDPFLADYGLCNFHPSMTAYVTNQATAGYIAPQVACQGLELTDKADVYNFGVVLIELATSKPPVLQHNGDDVLLLQMVRAASEEGRVKLTTYLDASLMRANPKFIAAEMMALIKLGISCTTELPAGRPTMAQVVRRLEDIKAGAASSRLTIDDNA